MTNIFDYVTYKNIHVEPIEPITFSRKNDKKPLFLKLLL